MADIPPVPAPRIPAIPVSRPQGSLIPRVAKSLPRGRLGFEAAHLTFDAYRTLKAHLPSKVAAMPVEGLVEEHRMVKSEAEIETPSLRLRITARSTSPARAG